jgi:hypothetical protein
LFLGVVYQVRGGKQRRQKSYIFIYQILTVYGKPTIKATEIDGDSVFVSFKFPFQSAPVEQLICIVKLPSFKERKCFVALRVGLNVYPGEAVPVQVAI